jgi:hypothetical protein
MESPTQTSDQPLLTAYQRRLWVEIDRILYENYLTPRVVTDFWKGDDEGIVSSLKRMKERTVRAIVLLEYVEVDDILNRAIAAGMFGKNRKRRRARRSNTLASMLDRLYPPQKVEIVRTLRKVPDAIYSHVMALNTLRNTFAHRLHLSKSPKSKRFYKGKHDVFTRNGMKRFQADMWEVHEFFNPAIMELSLLLVRNQRRRLERKNGH